MRRAGHRYRAVVWSLLAFYAVVITIAFLLTGLPIGPSAGPLMGFTEWLVDGLEDVMDDGAAILVVLLLYGSPAFLLGLLVFACLRGPRAWDDGHLHCPNCGYILKGLSEPRCPECGERI